MSRTDAHHLLSRFTFGVRPSDLTYAQKMNAATWVDAQLAPAAISDGEIDPKLENKQVILAYEKDGKPLDAPRLVVPGDLHAARSVQDVVSVAVQ